MSALRPTAYPENIHCAWAEKFLDPFIEFNNRHFPETEHLFLIREHSVYKLRKHANVIYPNRPENFIQKFLTYNKYLNRAKRIFLHGLFDPYLLLFLFLQPWLLKKSYWIIWGADLYLHESPSNSPVRKLIELFRRIVIRNIGHLVTVVPGDIALARKWYHANGRYHCSFVYPSNIFHSIQVPTKKSSEINILIGNSADPSNNHLEAIELVRQNISPNTLVYCPLSYGGSASYIKRIVDVGVNTLGKNFVPLLGFLPFEKYLELLGEIDVAIFAHKRQQALGNTITLLGLGKTIRMRQDVSHWELLTSLGLTVLPIENFSLSLISPQQREENISKIRQIFSTEALYSQLKALYGEELCLTTRTKI